MFSYLQIIGKKYFHLNPQRPVGFYGCLMLFMFVIIPLIIWLTVEQIHPSPGLSPLGIKLGLGFCSIVGFFILGLIFKFYLMKSDIRSG